MILGLCVHAHTHTEKENERQTDIRHTGKTFFFFFLKSYYFWVLELQVIFGRFPEDFFQVFFNE